MRLALIALIGALGSCSIIPGTTAHADEKARSALSRALYDAESARFQSVQTVTGGGVNLLCGVVNSKNKLGAYTGYARFVVDASQGLVAIDPGEQSGAEQREFNAIRRTASKAGCRF